MRPLSALLLLLLLPLLLRWSPSDPSAASLLGAVQVFAVLVLILRGGRLLLGDLARFGRRHRP